MKRTTPNNPFLSPADDTASQALIDTQTAITKVKEIVTECIAQGVSEAVTTARLNQAIAAECKKIDNIDLREQTRKSLVASARKWHYELKQTYRILNKNLIQQAKVQDKDLLWLAALSPQKQNVEFRKILDDGNSPGIPLIKDYQQSIKLAIKAMSAEPPKVIRRHDGGTYVMPLRNRAEMAVRYDANVKNIQELISQGVLWAWTSSHPNCSPRCKDLQGRLWSLFKGTVEFNGKTYSESGTIDGIKYEPIDKALKGPLGDGNGIISGYNCRHRLIAYAPGSKPPKDFTEAEIKREYDIDKQQRSYENRIRQMKTEERQLRAAGMMEEAKKLRKRWRKLTLDYQLYSIDNKRAFFPYRCVIDRAEVEETIDIMYRKWQTEIGKVNMPSSIDKFKDLMYNNHDEYKLLNHYHFARTTGRVSALADYNLFKDTKQKIETQIVGKQAANGTKIKSVSLHCVDRVIGTIYAKNKHEGMSIDTFEKILAEGTPSKKIKYDKQGKPSQKISLKGIGVVTINPDTGELIQCNKN